jgi:predicted DNA-binding ribbon-helix-helix protein
MNRTPSPLKIAKHSIIINGRNTSVSLETAFWKSLKDIAAGRGQPMSALIASVARQRNYANLSSALRLFVLDHFRNDRSGRTLAGEPRPRAMKPAASTCAPNASQNRDGGASAALGAGGRGA